MQTDYHTLMMPLETPDAGLNTKKVLSIAIVAVVGTFVGYVTTANYLATTPAVAHYAQVHTRLPTYTVPTTTSAVRAGPADWISNMLPHAEAPVVVPEVVPEVPQPVDVAQDAAEMLTSFEGSVGTTLGVACVAAFVAAALYFFQQGRSKSVAIAPSAGIRRGRTPMHLNANPLDAMFDKRKTVVITGASSGLGLSTARALAESGEWYVIMACRNVRKGEAAAKEKNLPTGSYEVMELELESLRSVRNFCKKLKSMGRKLDTLVCNAALYLPNQRSPDFTEDGFERCFQVNHLSHFLMIRLLLDDIAKSDHKRVVVVGSITGNNNTVGGGAVYPLADLGKLQGMKAGMQEPICMIDGKAWNGAKAYKDSKVCNMQTIRELHRRYNKQLGITFSTMYPGCIAETALFRQKRGWFRTLFPLFMKYVTGGYVSQEEAGDRLAECIDSEKTKKSGVYWSWNGGARTTAYFGKTGKGDEWGLTGAGGAGGAIFENEVSDLVQDPYTANDMYVQSEQLLGLKTDPREKQAQPALTA